MHRFLHATVTPLVVFAAACIARGVEPDDSELLRADEHLTYRHWLPRDFGRTRKVPLILFSHGFGGCAHQSASLTRALADAGYAVLAPNHKDEGERYFRSMRQALRAGSLHPEQPFTDPASWDAATELARGDDIKALFDHAHQSPFYRNGIDFDHVGLMGHSLGGYTALALGGAWNSWRDPRFKAVLALSPYVAPFLAKGTLGDIGVPVMYQTGTRDIAIGPALTRGGGYAATRAPKYLVVLKGAAHFAWTEISHSYRDVIALYAAAFFDRTLKGRQAPLLDQPPGPKVARYLHEA
jgi:predicted dienelactone hydrolase